MSFNARCQILAKGITPDVYIVTLAFSGNGNRELAESTVKIVEAILNRMDPNNAKEIIRDIDNIFGKKPG